MIFPDRFPFSVDVLDPDPEQCGNCSCSLSEAEVQIDCRYGGDCDCHQELGPKGMRYRWGDR